MVEMNQSFYVSLVVRKIKVYEDSPNFWLNNYIVDLLCSYFLAYRQYFLFNFFGFASYFSFNSLSFNYNVIHNVQYSLLCP